MGARGLSFKMRATSKSEHAMLEGRLPAPRELAMTLVVVAIAIAVHTWYIHLTQPDVPYMDTMRMLVYQQAWREGTYTLFDLWEPKSAHHTLLAPMLLAANVHWFGLDARLATLVNGWVIGTVFVMIGLAFLADRRAPVPVDARRMQWLPRMAAIGLFAMLLFSWAGFELLTLELGLPQWVKNVLFVGYYLVHSAWLRKPVPGTATSVVFAVTGATIVLLAGGGWGYGFVAAVVATQALAYLSGRRDRGLTLFVRWLPALALVAGSLVYSAFGENTNTSARAPMEAASLLLPLYGLGSTWIGSEAYVHHHYPLKLLMLAGTVTAVLGAWGLYGRWRRGMASASLVPVYLMAHGAVSAVLFAAGRGGWGIQGVMASRYYMDLVLFTIGTLWLLFEDAQVRRDRMAHWSGIACFSLAAAVFLGQAWTYRVEMHTAPHRAMAFDRIEEAFRRGATTEEDARLMQSHQPYARQAVAYMRKHGLSVFAADHAAACRPQAVRWLTGWYPPEASNRWMGDTARIEVPPCDCAASASVFIPEGFAARELAVDAGDGKAATLALAPGKMATLSFPASQGWQSAALTVSRSTQPQRDMPGNADKRTLGALLGPLEFACAAP